MAPPHSPGFLLRSLVRIPGSGHDMSSSPTQLDLSNVSSVAAEVPGRPLPEELLSLPNTIVVKQQKAASQKSAASNGRGKRKRDQILEDETHQPKHKISRCENVSQSHNAKSPAVLNNAGLAVILSGQQVRVQLRQVHQSTPASQPLVKRQQVRRNLCVPQTLLVHPTHRQHQNLPIPPGINIASLSEIVQQTMTLKKENAELQAKVSLFKQLFRNKQKLISVVRTLGLVVP